MCNTGRGEAIRLLLNDNDQDYEEVNCRQDWPQAKSKYAFGQTPALIDGDFQLVQFNAILRYLARKIGTVYIHSSFFILPRSQRVI